MFSSINYRLFKSFSLIFFALLLISSSLLLVACKSEDESSAVQPNSKPAPFVETFGQETSGGGGDPLHLSEATIKKMFEDSYDRLLKNQGWLLRKSVEQVIHSINTSYFNIDYSKGARHWEEKNPEILFNLFLSHTLKFELTKQNYSYDNNDRFEGWVAALNTTRLFDSKDFPKLVFEGCLAKGAKKSAYFIKNKEGQFICINLEKIKINKGSENLQISALLVHELIHFMQSVANMDFKSKESEHVASSFQKVYFEFYDQITQKGQLLTSLDNHDWFIRQTQLKLDGVCQWSSHLHYFAGMTETFNHMVNFNQMSFNLLFSLASHQMGPMFLNHFYEFFKDLSGTIAAMRTLALKKGDGAQLCEEFEDSITQAKIDLALLPTTLTTLKKLMSKEKE